MWDIEMCAIAPYAVYLFRYQAAGVAWGKVRSVSGLMPLQLSWSRQQTPLIQPGSQTCMTHALHFPSLKAIVHSCSSAATTWIMNPRILRHQLFLLLILLLQVFCRLPYQQLPWLLVRCWCTLGTGC